jgi:protease IV
MNTFFKVFFACLLAIVVAGFIFILIIFGIGASLSETEKPVVKEKTVLYVDLSQVVGEQGKEDDINLNTFTIESYPGLQDLIAGVKHAIGDSSVKAMYLVSRGNGMGLAASQEFGAVVDSFKASGKPIIAYADILPQRAYEIAHRASHIYAQPGGVVEWVGYNIEVMFFKNLLDRLYIQPEIFYAGQFKSATEPFRLTKMSDANRVQYKTYLDQVNGSMLASIYKHRKIDSTTLMLLANNLEVRTAEQAFDKGLVDGLLYEDQVRDTIKKLIGVKPTADIRFMQLDDYSKAVKSAGSGGRIAVVYADGAIVGGKGQDGEIGSDTYRSMLAKLRNDSKVKAVVLRINSPGGSAIASEIIWRELELLKKEKPLVVSMGDYAASGGYYIACNADSIFAMPNTLTGSIGVFTILIDAQKMFNDKLGINFDGVSTNTYSDFGNITRPMSAFEKQVAQRDVDSVYATFKSRVVKGRKLNGNEVDSIAQGRIWSGANGLQIGLVDRIGSLQDAIHCAARMADLDKYSIRNYPQTKSLIDKLFGGKEDPNTSNLRIISQQLAPQQAGWLKEFQTLQKLANLPQARLPFILQLP